MSVNVPLPAPYGLPQRPAQKTWLGRNWLWLLIVVVVSIVGLGFGLVAMLFGAIGHSEVVRGTFQRAESNPVLIERLGTPMKAGWSADRSTSQERLATLILRCPFQDQKIARQSMSPRIKA